MVYYENHGLSCTCNNMASLCDMTDNNNYSVFNHKHSFYRTNFRKSLRFTIIIGVSLFRLCYSSSSPAIIETSSSSTSITGRVMSTSRIVQNDEYTPRPTKIKVVFSDVDGTLVHYPTHLTKDQGKGDDDDDTQILDKDGYETLFLPPSSTGMRGVISRRTLDLCQILRKEHGVKLVLVSGMRSTTLLQRLPYLPLADAYCSEGGGRIFYPTGRYDEDDRLQLKEDLSWRRKLENSNAAGSGGYFNKLAEESIVNVISNENDVIGSTPIMERRGKLWDFARVLMSKGWIIDFKGYATSFRIKFRSDSPGSTKELLELIPGELSTSINLGMADVYPRASGKVNACAYLCAYFGGKSLEESCYCMCDDDNDIEMAQACRHAFLPSLTSESMVDSVGKNPAHFTVTCNNDTEETKATDAAVQAIIDSISTSN